MERLSTCGCIDPFTPAKHQACSDNGELIFEYLIVRQPLLYDLLTFGISCLIILTHIASRYRQGGMLVLYREVLCKSVYRCFQV